MKMRKPLLALLLVLVFVASAIGCSLVSVNEEKDMAQVVAKVGDHEITKQEYLDQLNYMVSMYQSMGMDPTASAEEYALLKTDMLDQMIASEAQYYQAMQHGLDKNVTEEELAEIQASVDEYDSMVYNEAVTATETRLQGDSTLDYDTVLKEEYRAASINYFGLEMNQAEARQYVEDFFYKSLLSGKMQEYVFEGVTVTDEEVRTAYDEQLAADKTSFTETPANYKSLQETFERTGGLPPFYAPEGYIRVRHISIASTETLSAEYDEKMAQIAVLESEMGTLVLQESEENTARMEEIRTEHAALKAETDQEYEAYISAIRSRAEEAYAKLQAGTKFEDLLVDYTSDTDFVDYEIFRTKGKLMSTDPEVADWVSELKTPTLALTTEGSYTELLQAEDNTFHILQYVGKEPSGERPFADYQEEMRANTLTEKQNSEWNTLLEEWIRDESYITRFQDVVDGI